MEPIGIPRVVPHGQGKSEHTLKGLPGENLELKGVGEEVYEWETEEKAALDLELRAFLTSTNAPDLKSPIVRYRVEFGHGGVTYKYPTPRIAPGLSEWAQAIVPARGLVIRLSARQLRVYFTGGTDSLGGPVTLNKINVSCQPSSQSRRLTTPYQQLQRAAEVDEVLRTLFPMEANEFRIRDLNGVALFNGQAVAELWGITDEPLFTGDVATNGMTDWTPIAPLAASLSVDIAHMVEFR